MVARFTVGPLYSWRNCPRYPSDGRLNGSQSRSGRCGVEGNLFLLQGLSVAIPTELSRLLCMDHSLTILNAAFGACLSWNDRVVSGNALQSRCLVDMSALTPLLRSKVPAKQAVVRKNCARLSNSLNLKVCACKINDFWPLSYRSVTPFLVRVRFSVYRS
jgi:hypothetical protein